MLEMTSPVVRTESKPTSAERVQQQLKRVISSSAFHAADRLKRFITFVVSETLENRADQLKEYVIGTKVFDKEASFNPRTDPIVRVQARQLRARLARYYSDEGLGDDLVIDLPRGGYTPVFRGGARAPSKSALMATLFGRNTIAVSPFADFSADKSLDYFCKGICQELTHALTSLGGLRVIVWDSLPVEGSAASRGRSKAAMTVEGGARQSEDQLRVTVQLVDCATGSYLWSASIDGSTGDPLSLQEKVARMVVARLRKYQHLGDAKGRCHPAENLAARNLYRQGRYHLDQRTEEGFRKAVDFFEKAIAEDARYANAYSGLADAYSLLGHYGVLAPAEVWTKAAANSAMAVMLDGESAEAYTSLAHVKSTEDWDAPGAQKDFQHAIELNPRYATAHHWYAMACLAPSGKMEEALQEMFVAQSLDPISSIVARDISVVHYYNRDFDVALEYCDHAIELNPYFSPSYWILGLIQEELGDHDEAVAALQRAIHLTPQSPRMQGALARVLAQSGKHADARTILGQLESLSHVRYVSPFELASVHFALGETEVGFEWLRKAFRDRCFELIAVQVDPRFEAIKHDRRFVELAQRAR